MRQENFQDIQAAMRVAFENYPLYDSLNQIQEVNQMTFQKPYIYNHSNMNHPYQSFSKLQPYIQQYYEEQQQEPVERQLFVDHMPMNNFYDSDDDFDLQDEMFSPQRIAVTPHRKDSNPNSAKKYVNKPSMQYKQKLKQELTDLEQQIGRESHQSRSRVHSISIQDKENTSPTSIQNQQYMNYLKFLKKDSKKKQDIPVFPPIEEELKRSLVSWLGSINLLKSTTDLPSLIDKLPKLAKSGVFFCDLINRMNGRISEPIKGINRKPNERQYSHNWYKVFENLRKNERMNPRYLYCDEVFHSNTSLYDNAFWCLLADIHFAFSSKITKQIDTRRSNSQAIIHQTPQPQVSQSQQQNNYPHQTHISAKRNSMKNMPMEASKDSSQRDSYQKYQSKLHTEQTQPQHLKYSNVSSITNNDRYVSIHTKENNSPFRQSRASNKSQITDFSRSPIKSISGLKSDPQTKQNANVKIGSIQVLKILQAQEKDLQLWLQIMIPPQKTGNGLFEDPLRNGLLLCKLLIKLTFLRQSNNIIHKPKNILECQGNWIEGLSVFNFIDPEYKKILIEKLLQGCRNTFYSIILQVRTYYNQWMENNQQEAIKQARKQEEQQEKIMQREKEKAAPKVQIRCNSVKAPMRKPR